MLVMFLWNEAELKKILKDRSFPSKVTDIWNRSPSSAMSAEMVSGELRGRLGDWTEIDDGSFNVGAFLFQTNCWFWTVLSVIRRASTFDIVVFSRKSSGVALCRFILLCNSRIVLSFFWGYCVQLWVAFWALVAPCDWRARVHLWSTELLHHRGTEHGKSKLI